MHAPFMMRSHLLTPIVIPVLAAAGFCFAASAQQAGSQSAPDRPVATLHVQAREVLLPVTVRDKHGAIVTNLQKGDFTLTEDGRPQIIKSFTRQSDLPFQVGLLVDTSRSVSGAMDHERKAAGKFVDQMLAADPKANQNPNDAKPSPSSTKSDKNEAFLVHFDREVELLQDFTDSRDKLHHEIDDMGPTSRTQDDRQGPETTGDDREHPRGGRTGTQLYDAIFLASDELMKPKDGRKALLLFSDGVDSGSKETLNEAMDAAEHANVSVYTIYFKGEQERDSGGFPGTGRHGGMGGNWPGGGGGYPGGRRSEEPQVDGKEIMDQIATRTGGRYFDTKKKEDLAEIYGLIADELHGQYLLTYTPDKLDNEGGYHKIVLKANNGDYTVTTREGYFAPGGDAK